jgi:hypothetical protein
VPQQHKRICIKCNEAFAPVRRSILSTKASIPDVSLETCSRHEANRCVALKVQLTCLRCLLVVCAVKSHRICAEAVSKPSSISVTFEVTGCSDLFRALARLYRPSAVTSARPGVRGTSPSLFETHPDVTQQSGGCSCLLCCLGANRCTSLMIKCGLSSQNIVPVVLTEVPSQKQVHYLTNTFWH